MIYGNRWWASDWAPPPCPRGCGRSVHWDDGVCAANPAERWPIGSAREPAEDGSEQREHRDEPLTQEPKTNG